MRKCFLMFAFWVIAVMIASLVIKENEGEKTLAENVVVTLDLKGKPLK